VITFSSAAGEIGGTRPGEQALETLNSDI